MIVFYFEIKCISEKLMLATSGHKRDYNEGVLVGNWWVHKSFHSHQPKKLILNLNLTKIRIQIWKLNFRENQRLELGLIKPKLPFFLIKIAIFWWKSSSFDRKWPNFDRIRLNFDQIKWSFVRKWLYFK